jgi:hypothetical protein
MILVMTVEPGFGGQKFLDVCLPKIRRARELMDKHGVETWLQVDGGVSLETIERCAEAGADVFVAGSAVFDADDPDAMVRALRDRATGERGLTTTVRSGGANRFADLGHTEARSPRSRNPSAGRDRPCVGRTGGSPGGGPHA